MASNETADGAHWQNHEIESLLNIWANKNVQNELENMHQNLHVYEKISTQLGEKGIHRSATSCRDKIKKLKFKYRRINEKKGHKKSFKFYEKLRSVLGDNVDESGEFAGALGMPASFPSEYQPIFNPEASHNSLLQTQSRHDPSRFSPKLGSNDSNSIVLTDSEYDSDFDIKGERFSDDDYIPDDGMSQYSESQASTGREQNSFQPQPLNSNQNMFVSPKTGRVNLVPSNRAQGSCEESYSYAGSSNSMPLNAARTTMKRRAECMRGGWDFRRGMFGGPPWGRGCHGFCPRGGGHHGKVARLEQTYDVMFNKIMQSQRETQDRFLASHEKQLDKHLQFELRRQEWENKRREVERKHEVNMFQMMIQSLSQAHKNHLQQQPQHGHSDGMESPKYDSVHSKQGTSNMTEEEVKAVWRKADAVCFDVDSTVVKDEGLDELAKFCGVGEQVSAWTLKAMGGGIPFRTALRERLNIIKPTKQQLHDFIEQHPPQLSDGLSELIKNLRKLGRPVYLVSGGFRSIIEPVAKMLSIPTDHIFVNRLKFYYTGEYAGFDETQLTSDSGGKPKVMQLIKDKFKHQKLVMIGDGATDLETVPPADAFIGYGGNVIRESVKNKSAWFITDFKDLINELPAKS